jgi:hypothetical protein
MAPRAKTRARARARGRKLRCTKKQRGGNHFMSYKCTQSFRPLYEEIVKGEEKFYGTELRDLGISGFLKEHPGRKRYLLTEIKKALEKSSACADKSPFGVNGNGEPSIGNGNSAIRLLNSNAEYTPEAEKILINSANSLLKAP